jgi:hypothetical protein
MSNIHHLFDYKKDDPLIKEYVNNFFGNRCLTWLDQKSYDNFHADDILNMFINVRKLVPASDELKITYTNFITHFIDINSVEYERLRKAVETLENKQSNINAQPTVGLTLVLGS